MQPQTALDLMAMGKLLTAAVVVVVILLPSTGGGGGGELLTAVVMMFTTGPLVSPCESATSLWGSGEQIQEKSHFGIPARRDSDPDPTFTIKIQIQIPLAMLHTM